MDLILYYSPSSFYSQRAFLALEEKGIPYRQYIISMLDRENLEPWFMQIQPHGTVPAIKNGSVVIDDSRDIILYLDEIVTTGPKFLPDSSVPGADRVKYLTDLMQPIRVDRITYGSALFREHSHNCQMPKNIMSADKVKKTIPDATRKLQHLAKKYPELRDQYLAKIDVWEERNFADETSFLAAVDECDKILGEVEEELAGKWKRKLDNFTEEDPWLCCDHFTIADIYLATLLHRLTFAGQAKRLWADGKRPHLEAYYKRVQQRQTFKTACGSANNLYRSVILPKLKYNFRKAFPRVLGMSVVMAIGLGIYVKYRGFPTWWPERLKVKLN